METQHPHTQPRGVRLEHVLHGEVQDLLDQLARAVMSGDGETVATLWETPGFVISADAVISLPRRKPQASAA